MLTALHRIRAVLDCATTSDAMAMIGATTFVLLVSVGAWVLSCPV